MMGKKRHIMRCPSDKMLEKIIAILNKYGMIHNWGGGCVPDADDIRRHWEETDLMYYSKKINY